MKTMRFVEVSGKFEIGDVVSVKLNNDVEVNALAVKSEFDEENGDTMTFIMNCLPGRYTGDDAEKFVESQMADRVDEEFKMLLIPYENGSLFRLPTEYEIAGNKKKDGSLSNEQFELMGNGKVRLGFEGGKPCGYWTSTMNKECDESIRRVHIDEYGEADTYYPGNITLKVRPVFRLKNSGN